jgi:GNAT superfamily N-acetyltransferase
VAAVTRVNSIHDLAPQLANCRDYWLGWGNPAGTDRGLTLYRSGVSHPQLNGVLAFNDGVLDDALADARAHLDGLPWMWWVGPDSRPGLADRLLTHGAAEVGTMPIMAADIGRVAKVTGPPGLSIVQITEPAELKGWVTTYGPSFGVASDQVDAVVAREADRNDDPGTVIRFEARINGEAVGTSLLLDRHGVAGVYVVTTLEAYRRQGIGSLLTDVALRVGQDRGLRIATLQASGAGRPIYERMGFETVGAYRLFTL